MILQVVEHRLAKGETHRFEPSPRVVYNLGPNEADIHFQFGLYYKTMKQRARALSEVRTALSLNPHFSALHAPRAKAALASLGGAR